MRPWWPCSPLLHPTHPSFSSSRRRDHFGLFLFKKAICALLPHKPTVKKEFSGNEPHVRQLGANGLLEEEKKRLSVSAHAAGGQKT